MSQIKVDTTPIFDKWFDKLKDRKAKLVIGDHIERMMEDNIGVIRSVGQGVLEKKINYGPGYRLYFYQKGNAWILLLCGGDKSTQQADIKRAKEIRKGLQ
jgi:putative addiction module killer protein